MQEEWRVGRKQIYGVLCRSGTTPQMPRTSTNNTAGWGRRLGWGCMIGNNSYKCLVMHAE